MKGGVLFGQQVCEALGLDPHKVHSLTISLERQEARVVVCMRERDADSQLVQVFKQFTLEPKP